MDGDKFKCTQKLYQTYLPGAGWELVPSNILIHNDYTADKRHALYFLSTLSIT